MTVFAATLGLIVTRKRIEVEAPRPRVPPAVAVAPAPRSKMTWLWAASKAAWSSPAASVMMPALAPDRIRSDPGTYVVLAGRGAGRTALPAGACPVLGTLTVDSGGSPGRLLPPVRSATVLVAVRFGANRSMLVAAAPGKYVSPVVVKVSVALVAPFGMVLAGA